MSHTQTADIWDLSFYVEGPYAEVEALFDAVSDMLCDCTDADGRCTSCGQVHERDDEGDPILCANAKPCRNPTGGMHPLRSEEQELRLYGTDALEHELARRKRL